MLFKQSSVSRRANRWRVSIPSRIPHAGMVEQELTWMTGLSDKQVEEMVTGLVKNGA